MGGGGDLNAAQGYYQSLGTEGQQVFQPSFNSFTKLLPMLLQTMQGQGSMYEAARSPAIAQAQQMLRTLQNQGLGSTANPNALFEDISTGAEQTASLGANQILTTAAQLASGLTSSGLNFAGQSQSQAGQGLTNVGEYEQNQMMQFISDAMSGIGMGFGLAKGVPTGGGPSGPGGINAGAPPASWQSTENTTPQLPSGSSAAPTMAPTAQSSGFIPAMTPGGVSQPFSAPSQVGGQSTAPGTASWQQGYYTYGNPGPD